jgi:hypothetical membrane protein
MRPKCYNPTMNLDTLRSGARGLAAQLHPQAVRQHPMFQDPISLMTLVLAAAVNVLTLIFLVVKLKRPDYPVPTHYLSLVGFDQTGNWINNYRLAVYGLAVTLVNGLLAAKSFQRNRLASFFLLIGAAVTSILCLVISAAFAVIV